VIEACISSPEIGCFMASGARLERTQQLDRTGRREAEQPGLNSAPAIRMGLPSPVGTGIGLIRACQQIPLPLRVTWHGDGDWDATDRLEGTHAAGGTGL
jgi:hypothetical protein